MYTDLQQNMPLRSANPAQKTLYQRFHRIKMTLKKGEREDAMGQEMMRAAVLAGPGQIEMKTVPVPEAGPGMIEIEVSA